MYIIAIMGANQSSQEILNNTLNAISMNIMTKNSTAMSGTSVQSNTLVISGVKDTSIKDFVQSNSSKINVQALMTSVNSGNLQADLFQQLSAAVEQHIPALAVSSDTHQKVTNAVTNAIDSNITTENFANISAHVSQTNTAIFTMVDKSTFDTITQKNEATLILELANKTTSDIIQNIKSTTTEA